MPEPNDTTRGTTESGRRIAGLFRQAPLYAILDTARQADLVADQWIDAWLGAGIRVIQYRHKNDFDRAHMAECQRLAGRVRAAGGLFFVNDRSDVAMISGADGVHLGQEDLLPAQARQVAGRDCPQDWMTGYSTHNLAQAEAAVRMPVDYLAIGPVYPTSTKQNPDPVTGLGLVRQVRSLTALPLVAIGGITRENAAAVRRAGADAVAVIGDLVHPAEPEARARELLSILKNA